MATQRAQIKVSTYSAWVYLDADVIETAPAGTPGRPNGGWRIRMYLRMSKNTATYALDPGTQYGYGNGVLRGSYSANPFLTTGNTGWNKGPYDFWVDANADGYWDATSTSYPLSLRLVQFLVGDVSQPGTITLPRIIQFPSQPPIPVVTSVGATAISFTRGTPVFDGGSAISSYVFEVSDDAGFSNIVHAWSGMGANQVTPTLVPSTQYWIRYKAVNGAGDSPWSDDVSAITLAAVAPTMVVTPSTDGLSASVAITPVGGAPVADYLVEYRLLPSGSVIAVSDPTSPIVVSPLNPGASYEWRSAVVVGGSQSPWTSWDVVAQPNPNTSPGYYFDGSTVDSGSVVYSWSGAADNSTSLAESNIPLNWVKTSDDVTSYLQRVAGGRTGAFSARLVMKATPNVNPALGAYGAGVDPGGIYAGSIYVKPSKVMSLRARIRWFDGGGVFISSQDGTLQTVSSLAAWTRLTVIGLAPVGAVFASVDVLSTGVGQWASGDFIDADNAMLSVNEVFPYFDGDSAPSSQWVYDWEGTPHDSASVGTENTNYNYDPLADPDCPPVPLPPRPPIIPDACVDDGVVEWRRYWSSIDSSNLNEFVDTLVIVNVGTGSQASSILRFRIYPNPNGLPISSLPNDAFSAEVYVSYLPPNATLTLDGVTRRGWVDIAGGESGLAADHLLYQMDPDASPWPILDRGIDYYITVDAPLGTPSGGITISYQLVQRFT